ncbi:Predicted amidohydrolase [Amycolatopsis marina]|uniref:Predicted amidohydrolase n=1 Tax=Amycolatopsis marina TaxID=490629 RepID=A0A1I0W4P9_9PSEU|nr:carbon-nitrogen hydrolase family protein [Amycolatopsis marina]SFA83327.1 Predicted amidohydrolase [Amycolatopsis marina]
MRGPLVIAVAQPFCVSHDIAANAVRHGDAVRSANAGVVVFPELSLTGYELDAEAITAADSRLSPIVEACAETGSTALVGAVTIEDGHSYIAMLAVDGDGSSVAYRKIWLHSTETARCTPGPGPVVLDLDGWRLGLAICKDTGTARHAADTAALGMDVYVAGVVHTADEAALHGERARRVAADHDVWAATASFAGPTGGGFARTAGRSGIWSADGVAVAQAGPDTGEIARATIT